MRPALALVVGLTFLLIPVRTRAQAQPPPPTNAPPPPPDAQVPPPPNEPPPGSPSAPPDEAPPPGGEEPLPPPAPPQSAPPGQAPQGQPPQGQPPPGAPPPPPIPATPAPPEQPGPAPVGPAAVKPLGRQVPERFYLGVSGSLTALPFSGFFALLGGGAVEAGWRVTDGTAFGVQGFSLYGPGAHAFGGVAEARYFYDIGDDNAEPYGAVGLGWGELRTPDFSAGALLLKLGFGGKRYFLHRHLYVGAEVGLFDIIIVSGTVTAGWSFF